MNETELKELFCNQIPVKLIIRLYEGKSYPLKLSREIDATYSHVVRILKQMEELGLIKAERKGRRKNIYLKDRGKNIARILTDLYQEIDSAHPTN